MKKSIFALFSIISSIALIPLDAFAQTYNFTVTNETEHDILELYVDDVNEEEWGENLLEGEVISPGETAPFEWADEDVQDGDPCDYHVLVVLDDGNTGAQLDEGINFCENPALTVTQN